LKGHILVLANPQNKNVSKMKIKCFGHGRLKHTFSQVEKIWIYNKSLNQFPFQEQSNKEKDNCNYNEKER